MAIVLCVASPAAAYSTELHIRPDGSAIAHGIIVKQRSGGNLFARMMWGEGSYARIVVVMNANTKVIKAHGEQGSITDIAEGDYIDVEGTLLGADGSINLQATTVHDYALLRESKSLSGNIHNINNSAMSFVLPNKQFGDTNVILTATTTIQKGARIIQFSDLMVGDKILAASGTYDYTNNTLEASRLEVYQDKILFIPRNFQGTLKSVSSIVPPAQLVVAIGDKEYSIYLTAATTVLNTARAATSLSRFVIGDTVRAYGAIRKTNFSEIDAEVVRDISF